MDQKVLEGKVLIDKNICLKVGYFQLLQIMSIDAIKILKHMQLL